MKYHRLSLALVAVLAALLAASCATKPATPKPEPSQPEPTVQPAQPSQPAVSQAELDTLLAKAQELRKRAFDLGLAEVLPDDYNAANEAYSGGKEAYDAKDGPAAKEKLGTAVTLFTELNAKGIAELASIRRKSAEDMRQTALKAGADTAATDRFTPGEAALAAGSAALAAKDYEAAIAAYERARALYELAYKRSLATELRDRIETSGYAAWDAGNYATAEAKYAAEAELFASLGGDGQAALVATDPKPIAQGIDALDEAVLRYNLVIQKAREAGAAARKQGSDEAKLKAEGIKAPVAAKDEYAAAQAVYMDAIGAMESGDYETAAARFDEATLAFQKAYDLAAEKKAKAEAAIKAAQEAAAAALKNAQDADSVVGGAK